MTIPTHRQLVHLTVCGLALFVWAVPTQGQQGDPVRGEKLTRTLGCLTCHTMGGQGGGGETKAPELANIFGTTVEMEGGAKVEVTEAYIRESIVSPDARVVKSYPAGKMPTRFTHLPEKDLAALVAYIKGGPSSVASALVPVEHGPAQAVAWLWVLLSLCGSAVASLSILNMARNISWQWIAAIVPIPILATTAGVALAEFGTGGHSDKQFQISARQFAYDPPVIKVHKGDRVTMTLKSKDVFHGFYLDGYDIDMEIRPAETVRFSFVANKAGRFSYRCSHTCGVFHPFMIGNFIVEPNYLFWGSIGLCFGLGLATFLYIAKKQE